MSNQERILANPECNAQQTDNRLACRGRIWLPSQNGSDIGVPATPQIDLNQPKEIDLRCCRPNSELGKAVRRVAIRYLSRYGDPILVASAIL